MSNRNLIIGVIVAAVLVFGGIWVYNWVLGYTAEASGPINAPTLEFPTPTAVVVEPTEGASPTEQIAPTGVLVTEASGNAENAPAPEFGLGLDW